MSDYTNLRTPSPTRFTFVGYRFDPRCTRATFYYRDNLSHHYAEKINFDCPDPALVDHRLLARALDLALFVLGLDYFSMCPTDLVAAKKPVSPRLAALIATIDPAIQLPPSTPRPGLSYQGTGNLVLMDPVDASLDLVAELTTAHLPFRPLYITASPACPPALDNLGKPLTLIRRPLPSRPLTCIALALVQAIFHNFNHIYLSYPADAQLTDLIHHEISPDLELIWKN